MVSADRTRPGRGPGDDARPDRGQMLVAGALVLAFLVIALAPVYNAVFAADSAGNGEPTELSDAAVTADRETVRLARELAVRVAHGDRYADNDSLGTAYRRALANGTRALGEASVLGADRYANGSFDPDGDGTTYGRRVVTTERGRFREPNTGDRDWDLVEPQASRLGWAVVRLETANLSRSQPLVFEVDNGSDTLAVELERTDGGDDVRVTVTGTVGATPEDVTCDARDGEVVLDLYRGRSASRDCAFVGLARLSGPVRLTIDNGDAARGTYEIVVRQGAGLDDDVASCSPTVGSQPCSTPALWRVHLATRVSDGRTTYTSATNVSVYGGAT